MRGRGSKGVVQAGRAYLAAVDLRRFRTTSPARFRLELDRTTKELQRRFPPTARHWGLARKGLNIFLRECLYTVYLREAYSLHHAEPYYELPLDSLTGGRLHKASAGALRRWRTVRALTPALSDVFQQVAASVAERYGVPRVHLDAFWWGERRGLPEA